MFCARDKSAALAFVSDHPFFVGVQYHPEFLSRPIKPSPPYFGLLLASVGRLPHYLQKGCRLSPRCGHSSLVCRGGPRLITAGVLSSPGSPRAACVPPGASPARGPGRQYGTWPPARVWRRGPGVHGPLALTAPVDPCLAAPFLQNRFLTLSWGLEFQE